MAVTVSNKRGRSGSGALIGAGVAVAAAYLMASYIFGLPPLARGVPVSCRGAGVAYQVFVDPTGSNVRRETWAPEADALVASLNACDAVSFFEIGEGTSGTSRHGDLLQFPAKDANAAISDVLDVEDEIAAKRLQAKTYLAELVGKRGARKSDIVGVFNKLSPDPNAGRNVLVIFSDGQESSRKLNLENSRACVSVGNVDALVATALEGRPRSEGLEQVSAIKWLVPSGAGVSGCNSRDELKVFWSAVIARLADGHTPALSFDTNVFTTEARSR